MELSLSKFGSNLNDLNCGSLAFEI